MKDVEIEYCVPCGHLDRAVETQKALLQEHGESLGSVALVPGDGGVFEVEVGGKLVYDKDEEGFDLDVIVRRVGDRLAEA